MAHDHHHLHSHSHSHGPGAHHHSSIKNIRVAFWLNTSFALIELIGGFLTNSVAIMSDALHDFGDSLSLGLAHYFEKKSTKSRDENYSYGYKRFSLLGAFINSMVLVIGSIFIIREAVERLKSPEQPHVEGMIGLAIMGIAVNGIAMYRLQKGSSVNERVISLHFLEDVLGWAAVLVGSIVMYFVYVPVLDPILSILIAAFILFNVYRNLKETFKIILQATPENIDLDAIKKEIQSVDGVTNVHHLHAWTMDGRYNVMTMHVVIGEPLTPGHAESIKDHIRHELEHLNIQHVTIETEWEGQKEMEEC